MKKNVDIVAGAKTVNMSNRYIYLKNGNELVRQEQFNCESKKLKIVEKWKSQYGKKFSQLTVVEDAVVKKEKYKAPKENKKSYGHVVVNRKKFSIAKSATARWNGYKD
jgi:archaellin